MNYEGVATSSWRGIITASDDYVVATHLITADEDESKALVPGAGAGILHHEAHSEVFLRGKGVSIYSES